MNGTTISRADRAALDNLWGKAGLWVADTWTELNGRCFAGKLRYRGIVWGLTPHGHALGHTSRNTGRITLHPALLDPADAWDEQAKVWGVPVTDMGAAFAADVLVHEMTHAWILQHGRNFGEPHNSDEWVAEIVRISPLLDLEQINAERIKARRIPNPKRTGYEKLQWSEAQGDYVKVWVPGDPKAPATVVTKDPRDGYLSQGHLAHWPHSVRRPGYYNSEGQMHVPV